MLELLGVGPWCRSLSTQKLLTCRKLHFWMSSDESSNFFRQSSWTTPPQIWLQVSLNLSGLHSKLWLLSRFMSVYFKSTFVVDYHKFIAQASQLSHSVHSSTVSSSYSSVSDSELSMCHLRDCTWLMTDDPIGGFFKRIVAVAVACRDDPLGMRFSSISTVDWPESRG